MSVKEGSVPDATTPNRSIPFPSGIDYSEYDPDWVDTPDPPPQDELFIVFRNIFNEHNVKAIFLDKEKTAKFLQSMDKAKQKQRNAETWAWNVAKQCYEYQSELYWRDVKND